MAASLFVGFRPFFRIRADVRACAAVDHDLELAGWSARGVWRLKG